MHTTITPERTMKNGATGSTPATARADATSAPSTVPIALDWQIGIGTSAELMALHLTTQLQGTPGAQVVPFIGPTLHPDKLAPTLRARVIRAFDIAAAEGPRLVRESRGQSLPMIALHLLGRGLGGLPTPLPLPPRRSIGIVQTCDTAFDDASRTRASVCDAVLAGSTWMRERLVDAGIAKVGVYPVGVDTTLFTPAPKAGHLSQRFVIFSGGRLHHHKGQDIVLAAVRTFRKRHPETLLLTTWQTPWPEAIGDLTSAGHAKSSLDYYGGKLDVVKWCADNGLPAGSVVDLGALDQAALAVVLREADVALFPNRAETDANPMLLECFASGVPVIASANTGHLDVVSAEYCYPLTEQNAVRSAAGGASTIGWGESSVDEIVAHLEAVYTRTSEARARATAAATFAKSFGWQVHAPRLLELVAPLIRDIQAN